MATCKYKGLSDCVDCPIFSECELMDARCFKTDVDDECDRHPSCNGCPATKKPERKTK